MSSFIDFSLVLTVPNSHLPPIILPFSLLEDFLGGTGAKFRTAIVSN